MQLGPLFDKKTKQPEILICLQKNSTLLYNTVELPNYISADNYDPHTNENITKKTVYDYI